MSRHHARIELTENKVFITDLGSSNGTFVNGAAIEPESPRLLSAGDTITIGNITITLRAPAPAQEPTAAAQQDPGIPNITPSPTKKQSWIKWLIIGIAIVVVLGGALLFIGSFTSPSESDTEDAASSVSAYSNSEYAFYFTYPKDWTEMPESIIGQEADIITGFWAPSEEYGITTNVLVAREKLPEGMDIYTYFELAQQSFTEGPPVTIAEEQITVDNIPGIKWTYRTPSAENVIQMHVSFIREDVAWMFIFTCAEKAFNANEATFDSIIDSFRFTDDRPKVILSTASLSEATMTENVDDYLRPLDATDVFNIDAPEIHCSVKLSNAPLDTEVKGEWIYIEGEEEGLENYMIDSNTIITEGTRYLNFSLSIPDNGWPVGEYEIVLSINGKEKMRVPFFIKK